jgi:hypothetical protein
MSNSSPWQQFSVEEFFKQSNWSGKGELNSAGILSEVSWLCQKIEDFFGRSNWSGELLSEIARPAFSLTLTVEGFFQIFAWEASAKIAPLPKLQHATELNSGLNADELRLDDFTDLF